MASVITWRSANSAWCAVQTANFRVDQDQRTMASTGDEHPVREQVRRRSGAALTASPPLAGVVVGDRLVAAGVVARRCVDHGLTSWS
jgi:hypothetical protein